MAQKSEKKMKYLEMYKEIVKVLGEYPELDIRVYPNRYLIIGCLNELKEASIKEVSDEMGLSYRNTFRTLKRLRELGYVKSKKVKDKNKTIYSLVKW